MTKSILAAGTLALAVTIIRVAPAPRPAVAWYAAVTALCIGGAGRSFQ